MQLEAMTPPQMGTPRRPHGTTRRGLAASPMRLLATLVGVVALGGAWASQALAQDAEDPPAADPPAAAAPADTAAGLPPGETPVGGPQEDPYELKLRELEEKVVGLKERIFRTKTRLLLLKERILNDVIAEAKAVILHVNDMGGSLAPVQVLYHLDGEKIFFQDNSTGALASEQPLEVFSGNLMPGNHVLSVEMIYRGDSGLFTYLKDYQFRLRANYTFFASKGKITQVNSVGYQKGDLTYDLTERPSIKFQLSQKSYTKEGIEADVQDRLEGGDEDR